MTTRGGAAGRPPAPSGVTARLALVGALLVASSAPACSADVVGPDVTRPDPDLDQRDPSCEAPACDEPCEFEEVETTALVASSTTRVHDVLTDPTGHLVAALVEREWGLEEDPSIAVVARLEPDGTLRWAAPVEGPRDGLRPELTPFPDGSVGALHGGGASLDARELVLSRLDAQGQTMWQLPIVSLGQSGRLAYDAVAVGTDSVTAVVAAATGDVLRVSRISADGTRRWERDLEGDLWLEPHLAAARDGRVAIAYALSLGRSLRSNIVILDAAGERTLDLTWVDDEAFVEVLAVSFTPDGDLLVSGRIDPAGDNAWSFDLGRGPVEAEGSHVFVGRLDPRGQPRWIRVFPTPVRQGNLYPLQALTSDEDGHLLLGLTSWDGRDLEGREVGAQRGPTVVVHDFDGCGALVRVHALASPGEPEVQLSALPGGGVAVNTSPRDREAWMATSLLLAR